MPFLERLNVRFVNRFTGSCFVICLFLACIFVFDSITIIPKHRVKECRPARCAKTLLLFESCICQDVTYLAAVI